MRYFIFFGCLVVGSSAYSQNRLLDSLYTNLINHPEEDTVRVNTITAICWYEYTFRPERNMELAQEALTISKKINYAKGIGTANRFIGLYYWAMGDYEKATQCAYNMLRIHEGIGYLQGVGQSYQLLSLIHQLEGESGKASDFYNKAMAIYKRENLKGDIASCYNLRGTFYMSLSKLDSASEYFLKSIEMCREINDEDRISAAYANLGLVYSQKKEHGKAQTYFNRSLKIATKLTNKYRTILIYIGLGAMYTSTDEYDKAEFYLLQSITLAKSIQHKKKLEESYNKLTILEKKRGRFNNALKYSELAAKYRDSIYTEDKAKKIAEVEVQYKTEKKDQVIQLLERDKKIQMIWRNIFLVAIILVASLSFVIYLLQRYSENKNREILNLRIDSLVAQQNELSEKYKSMLTSGNEKLIISHDQRLLKKALEIIESNMSDPLFSVEKMAEEMGMSRTNMHRKIKSITGFPPSELIRSIRLRKAALLIKDETDSISQISFAVGFEDQSYFSRIFKKQFSVSPSEYSQSKV